MAFAPLDPVLHNQLRLAIVSLLVSVESADFNFLLEKTGATRGNLSAQITKLKEAGLVNVKKTFKDNYPDTTLLPFGQRAEGLRELRGGGLEDTSVKGWDLRRVFHQQVRRPGGGLSKWERTAQACVATV